MRITRAYHYRLDPNKEQCSQFARMAGASRYAWNYLLGLCKDEYQAYKKALETDAEAPKPPSINRARLYRAICEHRGERGDEKAEAPWLWEVHSHCYSYPAERVAAAYKQWWSFRKKGIKAGPPRFKRRGEHDAFTIQAKNTWVAEGRGESDKRGLVRVPGAGWVRVWGNPHADIHMSETRPEDLEPEVLRVRSFDDGFVVALEGAELETGFHVELASSAQMKTVRAARCDDFVVLLYEDDKLGRVARAVPVSTPTEQRDRGAKGKRVYAGATLDKKILKGREPTEDTIYRHVAAHASATDICSITVSRVADWWEISIAVRNVRIEDPKARPKAPVLGVDFGVNALVTLSDGVRIEPPRALENALHLLRRRSRQFSRKTKGSKRHYQARMKLARLHHRVACIRKDYLHKLSRELVGRARVLIIEGFDVRELVSEGVGRTHKGKRKRERRRAMLDSAWGELRRQLIYKGEWYGCHVIVVDAAWWAEHVLGAPVKGEAPTDMVCSCCGAPNKMPPNTSKYVCRACGLETTRQLNTARLLASYGGDPSVGTGGHSGPQARGPNGSALPLGDATSRDEARMATPSAGAGNPRPGFL